MVTLTAAEWELIKWSLFALVTGGVSGLVRSRLNAWREGKREQKAETDVRENSQAHDTLDGKIKGVRADVYRDLGRVETDLSTRIGKVEDMTVRAHRRIEAHDVDLMALKTASESIERRMADGFERVDKAFEHVNGRFTEVNDSIVNLTTAVLHRNGA